LSTIELDLSAVPPFHRRVYQLARAIPPGQTLSYGEVAARLGSPGGARAVGQALRRNPFAVVVPCHRVVAAGGRLGGFSAPGGMATKTELLAREASPGGDEPRGPESPTADPALGFDPAVAGEHLRGADPVLGVLMDEVGPPQLRLTGAPTTFAALARSIVYQQLHGRAAAAIYGRLCALFPDSGAVLTPGDVNGATDEMLLGAGLSRAKMRSLRDLALRTTEGAVPTLDEAAAMDDEAIVEELSQVRGIGRWSAEMFLIFTLGRPDVLPTGDYGVRKGFAVTYRNGVMPTPKELLAFGERWRPYRSLASWYLWRALELAPDVTPVGPAAPVRAARPGGRAGPAARRP
jgi:methylated-DNA-[protein]-cysteine S-methyltransferase